MEILQAKDLKKIYGSGDNAVRALDGVDLRVEKGEFVAIVGTSGSGKLHRNIGQWPIVSLPRATFRNQRCDSAWDCPSNR